MNQDSYEPTRYELCEAIAAMCRGIELVCECTAIVQPFLNIYKKRAPVLLYAENFVAKAALKPKGPDRFRARGAMKKVPHG